MTGRPRSQPILPKCTSYPDIEYANSEGTSPVPKEFICSFCDELLREPLLAKCCRKNVCTPCLYEWQQMEKAADDSKRSCLLCHTSHLEFVVDHDLQRRMKGAVVLCRNKPLGCSWSGRLAELGIHLQSEDGCPYVSIRCPQNCGKLLSRKSVTEHLLADCILTWRKCEHCSDLVEEQSLEEHVKSSCPSYTLVCPNKCGAHVKRSQLPQHDKECPLAEITCPYVEAGCSLVMRRKESLDHQQDSYINHLLMAFQFLHTEVTTMKSKLQDTQEKQKAMAEELQKTKRELTAARMLLQQQKASTHLISTTLHTELNYFHPSSACHALALQCTRTQLGILADPMYSFLHRTGPVLTFRLNGYSIIKDTDKPWFSPPFYIKEGYKMCIAVHLNGDQEGRGTHISVHIHLMAGEYDSNLKWPLVYDEEIMVSLLRQHNVEQKQKAATNQAVLKRSSKTTSHRSLLSLRPQAQDSAEQSFPHSEYSLSILEQHIIRSLVFNLHCIQKPPGSIGLSFGHIALFCMQNCIDNSVLCNDSLVFQVECATEFSATAYKTK